MNHLRNSFYLVLIITSLSCSAEKKSQYQLVSPSKYSIDESTIANMDHAMQGFVDRKELAGIVALAAKNGELFYFKCFGMQDIENNRKMALNSSFQIQSMTKPITMTALMILIEEGKIKLDDPVEKYLPAYSNMSIIQGDGSLKPAQTVMTIKHCVMHLSGLANPAHPAVRSIVKFNETKSLKEIVDAFAGAPLLHEPGAAFTYGPTSTNLVARVVEIVSGVPFEQFINERIFNPLAMKDTYYTIPETELSRYTSVYKTATDGFELSEGPTQNPEPYPMGSRGLVSTAFDYFRFAQMLLNGGELEGKRILKKESVKLMATDLLPDELAPIGVGPLKFANTGFGLTLAISGRDASPWAAKELTFANLFNLPSGSFSWPGVLNTYWWADPSNQIVGLMFSQSADANKPNAFQAFYQELYQGIYH